jgi:hypothetical protein
MLYLCIIQDDGTDKSFQICQMDNVYGSDVLTVITVPQPVTSMIGTGLPGFGEDGIEPNEDFRMWHQSAVNFYLHFNSKTFHAEAALN